jgi:hypothetical protein
MTNAVIIAQQGSNNTTFRNRIINGAMVIFQRGTAATTNLSFSVDRWRYDKGNDATESVSQNSDAPTSFSYSLRNTISVGDAVIGAAQFSALQQAIEGYNIADLGWGTANAKTVTLSFWVRSSVTGQYVGNVRNSDDSRINPFNFTINTANTWEQKTITIAGDTSGTWLTTNSGSICIFWNLGCGATNSGTAGSWSSSLYVSATGATSVVGTNGATFYITGVQLEKGSTATSFDYRDYGTELIMCQRYYEKIPAGIYGAVGVRTTDWYGNIMWQVEKRTNATCTLNGTINIVGSVGDINTQTPTGIDTASTKSVRIYRSGSTFTTQAGSFYIPNYLEVSAEL